LQVVGEPAKIHLNQKGGKLTVSCKVVSVDSEGAEEQETHTEYVANIDIEEVPEDTELRTEVTAHLVGDGADAAETAAAIVLQLKVQ
jgi:ribosomal protein S16